MRAYWLAIKASWMIVAGVVIAVVAVAAALSWPSTPQYTSSTSLFVAAQTDSDNLSELYQRNAVAQVRISSYVALISSDSVTDEVSEAVGSPVEDDAAVGSVVDGTVLMEITVTDANPERARDIATAYGEVLPRFVDDLEQARDPAGSKVRLEVVDQADLPALPLPTPFRRNLMAALILGLGLGIGLAVLRYAMTQDKTRATPGADKA